MKPWHNYFGVLREVIWIIEMLIFELLRKVEQTLSQMTHIVTFLLKM